MLDRHFAVFHGKEKKINLRLSYRHHVYSVPSALLDGIAGGLHTSAGADVLHTCSLW